MCKLCIFPNVFQKSPGRPSFTALSYKDAVNARDWKAWFSHKLRRANIAIISCKILLMPYPLIRKKVNMQAKLLRSPCNTWLHKTGIHDLWTSKAVESALLWNVHEGPASARFSLLSKDTWAVPAERNHLSKRVRTYICYAQSLLVIDPCPNEETANLKVHSAEPAPRKFYRWLTRWRTKRPEVRTRARRPWSNCILLVTDPYPNQETRCPKECAKNLLALHRWLTRTRMQRPVVHISVQKICSAHILCGLQIIQSSR